jgi:hypothetical protein
LEFYGVLSRRNEKHKKIKEAWTEAQDSSGNNNVSHEREKP